MATLSTTQLQQVAAYWANAWFVSKGSTANYSLDQVQAAAQSMDQAFDTTINAAQAAGFGAMPVIQAINANIPPPFNGASLQQKIELACHVLEKRAGLI